MRAAFALILAAGLAAPADAQERIPSHCIALAEGFETIRPVAFGDPLAADAIRLRYLTHSSLLLETAGGLTAVTDYNGYTGVRDLVPDVVTMNNAHASHWTPAPDARIPNVLQGWSDDPAGAEHRLDLGEMLVRNVTTDVRSFGGVRPEGNSIFIFEVAGLCVGHLGHLHQIPTDEDFAAIGRLDVLMVPVDGGYTLDLASMAQVVRRLRSSVVIPMHWFSGASLDMFLADIGSEFEVVETASSEIELSLDRLPARPTIMVLEPALLD